jgi:hypothetical protein
MERIQLSAHPIGEPQRQPLQQLATATQSSPSSSGGAPESSGVLAGSVLAAAGFIFAGLL